MGEFFRDNMQHRREVRQMKETEETQKQYKQTEKAVNKYRRAAAATGAKGEFCRDSMCSTGEVR